MSELTGNVMRSTSIFETRRNNKVILWIFLFYGLVEVHGVALFICYQRSIGLGCFCFCFRLREITCVDRLCIRLDIGFFVRGGRAGVQFHVWCLGAMVFRSVAFQILRR